MASRSSVWRKAEKQNRDRWAFEDSNVRGGGKGRWVCLSCEEKVFHALSPKDPDNALKAHLREVRNHERECRGR